MIFWRYFIEIFRWNQVITLDRLLGTLWLNLTYSQEQFLELIIGMVFEEVAITEGVLANMWSYPFSDSLMTSLKS